MLGITIIPKKTKPPPRKIKPPPKKIMIIFTKKIIIRI